MKCYELSEETQHFIFDLQNGDGCPSIAFSFESKEIKALKVWSRRALRTYSRVSLGQLRCH